MPELLSDDLLLPIAVAVAFPVVVFIGVRVLRRFLGPRDPDAG